jgi:predicted nucleic-acid-binding Zn-ribbon protein
MPITQEQIDKFNAWMRSKGIKRLCYSCGHMDWGINDIVSANSDTGAGTIPMLLMACNHCGYIRLYSAVIVGL